jgi:hypothetical protein
MHSKSLGLALALSLAAPVPALACSICGCGDPLLAASDPAAITGNLRLQLDSEYVEMTAAGEDEPGSTDRLTQWSYRVNAVWRPLEPLALFATVPLVKRTLATRGDGARLGQSSVTGLGDVELGGRWAFWSKVEFGRRRVQELAASAGASLPTGRNDVRRGGELVDPHGQLGSGAFGPFAGVHYRLEQGAWSGFASLSYRLRTEGRYPGGSRYRFGNAALWSVHGQVQAARWLALDLGLDGRHAAADRARQADGAVVDPVANTGGTVIAVSPGVYARTVGDVWLFVRAQVPAVKRLAGRQDVLPTLDAGVQLQVF